MVHERLLQVRLLTLRAEQERLGVLGRLNDTRSKCDQALLQCFAWLAFDPSSALQAPLDTPVSDFFLVAYPDPSVQTANQGAFQRS